MANPKATQLWFGKAREDLKAAKHRNVKRRTRPMLGFKSFWSAKVVLAGIELVNMIKKGQLKISKKTSSLSLAEQFYSLAA